MGALVSISFIHNNSLDGLGEHIKMLKTNNKDLVEKALNFLRNFTENFKDGQEEMMRDSSVVPILLRLLKEGNKITLGRYLYTGKKLIV